MYRKAGRFTEDVEERPGLRSAGAGLPLKRMKASVTLSGDVGSSKINT